MNVSIPSILLGLGGKCVLNWTLVILQSSHIWKSFLGVFSVSLAAVDTALTLAVGTLHIHADGYVVLLGVALTRYHICLLVQILGQVYSALQWPVVVVAALDHVHVVVWRSQPGGARTRWIVCGFASGLLWYLAAAYVFLLSDVTYVFEDVPYSQVHHCWVVHTSQILQVSVCLFLTLGCAALHAGSSARSSKNPPLDSCTTGQAHSRRNVVRQAVHIFLSSWGLSLAFLAVLLLLPVGIPAYLGLNVAWLCFLNSFLITVVLCAACPASRLALDLAAVPLDSFCKWRFKFSLATEDKA